MRQSGAAREFLNQTRLADAPTPADQDRPPGPARAPTGPDRFHQLSKQRQLSLTNYKALNQSCPGNCHSGDLHE